MKRILHRIERYEVEVPPDASDIEIIEGFALGEIEGQLDPLADIRLMPLTPAEKVRAQSDPDLADTPAVAALPPEEG